MFAFTLAEVLITLVIIGVIAAITVPSLIAKYHEQQTISRVKKMYSVISQVVREYQFENSCTYDISACLKMEDSRNTFSKKMEKYINFSNVIYVGEDSSNASWLPKTAKYINGNSFSGSYVGITQGTSHYNSVYGLTDGTLLSVEVPDSYKQSGFIFFDVNGVKKPNQIGKDQFVIGIGAYNNPKYANKVHPFFNDANGGTNNMNGLCDITNNNECNIDNCTKSSCSPTAYLLKYNKLPPI